MQAEESVYFDIWFIREEKNFQREVSRLSVCLALPS